MSFSPRGDWPPIDERLVTPETRYEMLDGELIYVSPADGPHGTLHAQLAALLEAHVAAGFIVAVDMLTRTSKTSDIAPDASVYPRGRDRVTKRRRLDELSFEIASTQTLAYVARKARALSARGVRRVFAIEIDRQRVAEWSAATDGWTVLAPDAVIADRTLAVPLRVAALALVSRPREPMAKALRAQRHEEFLRERAEGRRQGRRQGRKEGQKEGQKEGRLAATAAAVLAVLRARGLGVTPAQRRTILAERGEARLARWLAAAVTCRTAAALLLG